MSKPMPARLSIHPGPARSVDAAVRVLSGWIDVEHLRLGGGTALEARWHHRASTDLHFFAQGAHVDTLFYERAEDMVQNLEGLAVEGAISSQDIRLNGVRELFAQLSPQECAEFMISTDGSPREIARLMRVSGVRRGVVVNWVNQYSSDPDWREDTMLAIQYAERERRADRQPVSKVDGRVSTATGGKP